MKPKTKIALTESDYVYIKEAALALYKERAVKTTADAFWGKCAAQAVLGVLQRKGVVDFELDLPAPDWKRSKKDGD